MDIREASLAYIEDACTHDHAGETDRLLEKIQRVRPTSKFSLVSGEYRRVPLYG